MHMMTCQILVLGQNTRGVTPENTFLGIEFDAICSEFSKGFFKIGDKVVSPFGLNYDVVDVGLNGPSNEVPEAVEHIALVSCPCVL